jgi:hypothetical protein
MTSIGPYETEQDAWSADMPRAVAELRAAEGGVPEDRAQTLKAIRSAKIHALVDACFAADVKTGAFDDKILRWLSGWEDATVQVMIGLIGRAYESGKYYGALERDAKRGT